MTVRTALRAHVCLPTREKTPEKLGAWEAADGSRLGMMMRAASAAVIAAADVVVFDGQRRRIWWKTWENSTTYDDGPRHRAWLRVADSRKQAARYDDGRFPSPLASQHVHTATAAADDRHGVTVYKNHCGGLWSFYIRCVSEKKAPLCFWL